MVADGQPVTIKVISAPGKTIEQKFRKFGAMPHDVTTVNVTLQDNAIVIETGGKPIWAWQSTAGQAFGGLHGAKTVEEGLEQNKRSQIAAMGNAALPSFLIAPKDPWGDGVSKMTAGGMTVGQ
ncbi:MAG: hypothetical protein ACREIT_09295 [Tepidisphaeraceae bacterium]